METTNSYVAFLDDNDGEGPAYAAILHEPSGRVVYEALCRTPSAAERAWAYVEAVADTLNAAHCCTAGPRASAQPSAS